MTLFNIIPENPNPLFYRYITVNHEYGCSLHLELWYQEKETKCGYWITDRFNSVKKWVSKTGKKRYAYPTKEQALLSFVKRKTRQIKILTAQKFNAEQALKQAEALFKKEQENAVSSTK